MFTGMWQIDLWSPDCEGIKFCCPKPPGLWSFVTASLGNECISLESSQQLWGRHYYSFRFNGEDSEAQRFWMCRAAITMAEDAHPEKLALEFGSTVTICELHRVGTVFCISAGNWRLDRCPGLLPGTVVSRTNFKPTRARKKVKPDLWKIHIK